jgi:hypothetical protein
MKVGIGALKILKNGQLLIETEKKSELEEICKKINEVSGEELEGYMPTLKNLRIIIFNVPEDITSENVAQATVLQNSDLNLNESETKPKFVFEDRKKHKNLVTEMNSETRKRLVDRKLKTGWHVCSSNDYLSFNISGIHTVVLYNLSEMEMYIPSNTTMRCILVYTMLHVSAYFLAIIRHLLITIQLYISSALFPMLYANCLYSYFLCYMLIVCIHYM